MADGGTAHAASRPDPVGPGGVRRRDGFLDVVRAIATVRVVLWHAFGAPIATYLVAAMPAMFFVSGHLFARSLDRRGATTTVVDRFRRLLPPLWLFTVLAWAGLALVAAHTATAIDGRRVVAWLVPLVDPSGTEWEAGWLSTPLWYLRVLTWLLLLGPLIVVAVRLWPRQTLLAAVLALLVLDRLDRSATARFTFAPMLSWQVGDVVLYGTFFGAGVWAATVGLDRLARRPAVVAAVAATIGAMAWLVTQPVPEGIVNNSHPMHLLVGVAWLGLALALRPQLERVASAPVVGVLVRWIGQRSLTIYLWHTAAILAALRLLDRGTALPPGLRTVAYLGLIASFTVVAVMAFGWVEDLAARRSARAWPTGFAPRGPGGRWAVPVAALAVLVASAGLAHAGRGPGTTAWPRVPSQAPPRPVVEAVLAGGGDHAFARAAVVDDDALVAAIDAWLAVEPTPGLVIGIAVPGGERWIRAVGSGRETGDRTVDDELELMSITKLFTANLVYRFADAGLIDLDAPLPPLDALPDFPYLGAITPRALLSHRSGLANYRETPSYLEGADAMAGPVEAVRAVGQEPLGLGPEGRASYSSTNYLVLGFLLEQVSGRSFDSLLVDELLAPLQLGATAHRPPSWGEPNFSTAGLWTSIDDLLVAGEALLREHVGISAAAFHSMTTFDPGESLAAGSMGYCPCTAADDDGSVRYFAIGHSGGWGWVGYLPDYDLVLALDLTDGLWVNPGRLDAAMGLVQTLAELVRSGPIATEVASSAVAAG